MRFTLQRHTTMAAIGAVQQAIGATSIAILKNVLVQASDGILDIIGTNGDLQVRHTIPDARIERDGAVTVSAEKLRDSVASLAEGADFMFEFDPDGAGEKRATLKSGRARFSMVTLPARDFPMLDEDSGAAGFTIGADAFVRLLAIAGSCAASEKARPYLNGVFVHEAEPGLLRAVGTDSRRMSWAQKAGVEGVSGWGGVILAAQTVDVVTRLMRNEDPDGPVTMDAGESRVMFGIGRSTVISKVIGARYVEYRRVVPTKITTKLSVDTDLMIGALGRALVMMDGATQSVTMHMDEGGIRLSTQSANAGDLADQVDADFEGEPAQININGVYLRDLLSRVRTENTLIGYQTSPACLTIGETGASDMFSCVSTQHG